MKKSTDRSLMLKPIGNTETEIKIAMDYFFMLRNRKAELCLVLVEMCGGGHRNVHMLLMGGRVGAAILEVSPAVLLLGSTREILTQFCKGCVVCGDRELEPVNG